MYKAVLFFLSTTIVFNLWALPTVESLFRNGSNKEIQQDTVVLKLMIRDLMPNADDTPEDIEVQPESDQDQPLVKKEKIEKDIFLKMVFHFSDEEKLKVSLICSYYGDGRMLDSGLLRYRYIKDISKVVASKEDGLYERDLFTSLMSMLALNTDRDIKSFFRNYVPDFKTNKNLINLEKESLLKRYQNYLTTVADEPTLKETLVSPLKPEVEEEKESVKNTMSQPMYVGKDQVYIDKSGNDFLLKVFLGNFKSLFSNEKHQLQLTSYMSGKGQTTFSFHDYILFNGIHEMPKNILAKLEDDSFYEIKVLSLKHLTFSKRGYNKLLNKYQKLTAKGTNYELPRFVF
ncbi:MAG: hypothetical protein HOE90_01300 [Bacteriovoracaceae bacterium]|jgi:hypothetical protein|nr:hypothetical protein [Bacteriovoracaceae bacterium]